MNFEPIVVTGQQIAWKEFPNAPAGVLYADIEGTLSTPGPFITRVKFPANCVMNVHYHPAPFIERETVISGTFYLGFGSEFDESKGVALLPGSVVVIPPETKHFAWTKEETIIQVHGTGPWIRKTSEG